MVVGSSLQQISSDMTVSGCEAPVKRTRRYPRVNPFRWIKKDRKKKSRHSRSHQTSRRSEEKTTTSSERGGSCDPTSDMEDEPLQGERQSVRTEEESGHVTPSDQHLPGEAVDSGENQEKIMEGGGLRRDPRVTEDRKIDGPPEGSPVPTMVDGHHQEDSRLEGNSKEASDLGPPKTENVEGVRSSPIKITAPHHKKDRRVKFSEVVTMILIGEHCEERIKERLLPVCINDGDTKRKMEKTPTGQDQVDMPAWGKSSVNDGDTKRKMEKTPTGLDQVDIPAWGKSSVNDGDTKRKMEKTPTGQDQVDIPVRGKSSVNDGDTKRKMEKTPTGLDQVDIPARGKSSVNDGDTKRKMEKTPTGQDQVDIPAWGKSSVNDGDAKRKMEKTPTGPDQVDIPAWGKSSVNDGDTKRKMEKTPTGLDQVDVPARGKSSVNDGDTKRKMEKTPTGLDQVDIAAWGKSSVNDGDTKRKMEKPPTGLDQVDIPARGKSSVNDGDTKRKMEKTPTGLDQVDIPARGKSSVNDGDTKRKMEKTPTGLDQVDVPAWGKSSVNDGDTKRKMEKTPTGLDQVDVPARGKSSVNDGDTKRKMEKTPTGLDQVDVPARGKSSVNDGDTKRKMEKTPTGQDQVDIPARGKSSVNDGDTKRKMEKTPTGQDQVDVPAWGKSSVNDGDTKRKMEKTPTGLDQVGIPARGKSSPPKNVEGIKQKRKRATVSSCEAEEAGSFHRDPTKRNKKKMVEGTGTSLRAPSPESPTKQTLKQQHEPHVVCHPIMKSEDGKVIPGPPNTPPKNQEQKFMKSYACATCGKMTHWSKLNVQQKENVERRMAHTCRMCGQCAAPAQKVRPRPLTTDPRYDGSSQPDNQRIPAYSSDRTESPQISAEKQQRQHKVEMKDEGTPVKSGGLITVSDRRTKGPKSQDDNKSSVSKKCGSPGAPVDPKPKTLHPKLKVEGSSSTAPGLESRKKVKNVSRKSGDSKEHEGRAKNEKCYMAEQRKGQPTTDEQKKPSVTQKMQEDLKTSSAYDPENLTSDKQCAKCGKSLKKHVNPENPGEGGENCVLRLKKKRKRPPRGEEPFECKQCGKTFTRHFTLLQHRMIHTGERPHSCTVCGKTFRDHGYLKVHMRSHTKEKPYTCSECGKRFGQNSAMVAHLRIHTDERPFKCNECGKRFSDRSTFRHHQMIHTGEKPYTCSFCGKKFTQQAHVKRHEKMHTGERPFGCNTCEKRFVDRTKLRKHELTHTRVKD